eukprot:9980101-Ditylum_brightwellii.AAC.1
MAPLKLRKLQSLVVSFRVTPSPPHLLYGNEEELKLALQIVEDFSNGINMTFRLDKCAILLITNGEYVTTNICLEIPKLDDEENKGYRYL